MALKEGLSKSQAIKVLETYFAWSILYFENYSVEQNEDLQDLIQAHKDYYNL